MAASAPQLEAIAAGSMPSTATVRELAAAAAADPGAFFHVEYGTVRGALVALVEGALNADGADSKLRIAVLTLLANLACAQEYAPVLMEAVQTLSEGCVGRSG